MDVLERVITEKADELIEVLILDVGLSRRQSEVFLDEAGAALVASYRWQAEEIRHDGLASPSTVRNLLAGISGRALANRVGLPTETAWDGLRALVPAVVRAGTAEGSTRGGGGFSRTRRLRSEDVRFDIGFGLTLDLGGFASRRPAGSAGSGFVSHPVFDLLPRRGPVSL